MIDYGDRKRRKRKFWEDYTQDQQNYMLTLAQRSDAAKQARVDDLREKATDLGSTGTSIYTYQFEKPDWWSAGTDSMRRKYMKQAERDLKRSIVKRTVHRKIGGGVDVTLSRRRGPLEGGGIEGGVAGNVKTTIASYQRDRRGNLVQTYDFFKDNPDPAVAAKVFGIPWESAFDNLPPSRPRQPERDETGEDGEV